MKTNHVLVADGSRAAYYRMLNDAGRLSRVWARDHVAGRRQERELVTDRPGRVSQSGGGIPNSALNPQTAAQDVEHQEFARELARVLEAEADRETSLGLAIVAPPRFLGMLRKELSPSVVACLTAESAKDLTWMGERELGQALAAELVVPPVTPSGPSA